MNRTRKQLIACVLSFALLFGMIPAAEVSASKKVSLSTKKLTVTKGKSKTLKVKNTKKKVTWKVVSGKKYITLKKKNKVTVTIKGKKKGKAKVQAKTGKKKLTCTVTVKNAKKPANTPKPDATDKPVPAESTKPAVTSAPPTGTQTPSVTTEPSNKPLPANPTNAPEGANEQDVAALKALIAEQCGRGATVSENMSSDEYDWEYEKGNSQGVGYVRLTGISWDEKNLSGELNVSELLALKELDCDENKLNGLDVSKNVNLTELDCSWNQLSSLDVSNNINLTELDCSNNQLSSLDLTNNKKLTDLECDVNVTVIRNDNVDLKPQTGK